jgi:hypothetical protein
MIGVQSLSTEKLKENNCGYNSIEDLTNCMMLSAYLLRKSVSKVVFYTDTVGAELVKPFAHLYDEIVVCLDDCLKDVKWYNWAFSKLLVYSYQTEPFVHVDNDVFLWDGLPKHFFDAKQTDFFFQNIELFDYHFFKFYPVAINECINIIPHEVLKSNVGFAYNMGIAGFNDTSIVQPYYEMAKAYIEANKTYNFQDVQTMYQQSVLFEQWFITHFVKDRKVDLLLDVNTKPRYNIRYTHLLASSKHKEDYMLQVKARVQNIIGSRFQKN